MSYSLVGVTVSALAQADTLSGAELTEVVQNGVNKRSTVSAGWAGMTATVPGANAVARTVRSKISDIVSVEDFGAVGDGVADDSNAIEAALSYVKTQTLNGGRVNLTAGRRYRVTRGFNLAIGGLAPGNTRRIALNWEPGAEVLVDFTGASNILFKLGYDAADASRNTGLTGNIRIRPHSNRNTATDVLPVYIEGRWLIDAEIGGDYSVLLGPSNNTMVRLSTCWNCDMRPLSVWSGGTNRPWKAVVNARYSITSGTTTLTTDADVFSAEDVGHILMVQGTLVQLGQKFTITAVTDARTATVAETAIETHTNQEAIWEPIRISISSGSTTVTAEAPCFVASDVGRVIYILDAGRHFTTNIPHRATITSFISSTQVAIDVAADAAASLVPLVMSPAVEIWSEQDSNSNPSAQVTDDFNWPELHIEEPRGTGLVVLRGTMIKLMNLKIHGTNQLSAALPSSCTAIRAIFAGASGWAGSDFQGGWCNRLGSIIITGQSGVLNFTDGTPQLLEGAAQFHARTANTGVVTIGAQTVLGRVAQSTINGFIDNQSTAEVRLIGFIAETEGTDGSGAFQLGSAVAPRALQDGQAVVARNSGVASMQTLSGGAAPRFVGSRVAGTLAAPTQSLLNDVVVEFVGEGLDGLGALQDIGHLRFVVDGVSGSNISGRAALGLRNSSNVLTTYWNWTSEFYGPQTDNTSDIGWPGGRVRRVVSTELRPGAGNVIWTSAAGSPEGVVTAPVGSMFLRSDGGAGSTLYIKESGTGNTGWVAK